MGLFGGPDNSAAAAAEQERQQRVEQQQRDLKAAEEKRTRMLRARMTGGAIGGLSSLNKTNNQNTLG